MPSANGVSPTALEAEASHYSTPEMEDELAANEATHYSHPETESAHYANPEWEGEWEDEWEAHETAHEATHESSHYSNPEYEWEAHETSHYTNPEYEDEAALYSNPEMEEEWEAHETAHYANPEYEYEAARHARPHAAGPRPHTAARPHAAARPVGGPRPHVATRAPAAPRPGGIARPQGVTTGPPVQPRVAPGIKHITRNAPRVVPQVVRGVLGAAVRGITPRPGVGRPLGAPGRGYAPRRPGIAYPRYAGWRPGVPYPRYSWWRPGMPWPRYARWRQGMPQSGSATAQPGMPRPGYAGAATSGPRPTSMGGIPGRPGIPGPGGQPMASGGRRFPLLTARRRSTVAGLLRQLSALFGEGESEAAHLEAQLFGANEFEGELATHEIAHEAALTEVLAAEAAHSESESEAAAILGASLPITIRIMGGRRPLRRVTPTLVRSNARLVRGLHRSGPEGQQLLRAVPAIQRRTVASLRAAMRQGRPITPTLVTQVMAGQAARVLGTPPILGPVLVRNTAIRQGTVAPAGRMVRPRRVC